MKSQRLNVKQVSEERLSPLLEKAEEKDFGDKNVNSLLLSDRTSNALKKNGIKVISQLSKITPTTPSLGLAGVIEITEKLEKFLEGKGFLSLQELFEQILTDFEREIIYDRLGLVHDVRTLEEIAANYGLTRERVRQIENKSLDKIRRAVDSGIVDPRLVNFMDELTNEMTLLRKIEDLSPVFKTEGVIALFTRLYPEKITIHENKYLSETLVLNPNKVKEVDIKVKEIRDLLAEQVAFVSIKEVSDYFDCPEFLVRQTGTITEDGYIALESNNKAFGKDAVFTIENLMREEQQPMTVNQLMSKTGLEEEAVRRALARSKKAVNIGLSTYGLKEYGFSDKDTRELIESFLEEAQEPMTIKQLMRLVQRQRVVSDGAIYNALMDRDLFQRVSEDLVALRKWGYETEYDNTRERYEIRPKEAVLKVLKNSSKPLNTQEIIKELEEKYNGKTSTKFGTITNALWHLSEEKAVEKVGNSRAVYYQVKEK